MKTETQSTEILTVNEKQLALDVLDGRIVSHRQKDIVRKGVRVFGEGRIYSASHVGEISDDVLVGRCMSGEHPGLPYDHELPAQSSYKASLLGNGIDLESVEPEMEAALELLRKEAPGFIYSGKAIRKVEKKALRTSTGIDHEIELEETEWELFYRRKGSKNILDGAFGDRFIVRRGFEPIVLTHLPYLQAWDRQAVLENGAYPVLFPSGQELLGGLRDSLRADKYHDKAALFSGRLGERILDERVTLHDVNDCPERGVFMPFDGEGVARRKPFLPLIENGILTGLIHDLRHARKYESLSTGNGQRSFDSSVSLGFNRLAIAPGLATYRETLASLDDCIVVMMAAGGDFTDSGDYSTPVQLAFLLRKGEIVGRLPQLTLRANLKEYFGSRLIAISSDGFQESLTLDPCVFAEMDVFLN